MFSKRGFIVILCLGLTACTRNSGGPEDPKRRLSEYISRSFAVKNLEDRQELAIFLTGEAKTRLLAWSEDQFRAAFIESKRQYIKLLITEMKSISPTEVRITYELTYVDQGKGHDAKVTNKKLCQMIKDQDKWYISDVHNIKEWVEYQNELSLP